MMTTNEINNNNTQQQQQQQQGGGGEETRTFRIGRLDHVHIRVPNRAQAVEWYRQHFGMEPVPRYQFWADGLFQGGPVQVSADGGRTMLALFQATEHHPMIPQQTGVAFSLSANEFVALAINTLPNQGLQSSQGKPLTVQDLVDLDLCWAFNVADPWGNQYEINCYEYDYIQRHLVDKLQLEPIRYWPKSVLTDYQSTQTKDDESSAVATTK